MTDLMRIAFEETGEQLERIACYLRRERYVDPKVSRFYYSDGSVVEDNIVGTLDDRYSESDLYVDGEIQDPNAPRLIKAELGTNVTKIGQAAFSQCDNLSALTIPNSVSSIDSNSIQGSGLKSLYVPDSVVKLESYVFANSVLGSISLPGTISALPSYAFENSSLTSIVFREPGLRRIGSYCFEGIEFVQLSLTIPETIESIGENAFLNTNVPKIWFTGKSRTEVMAMTDHGEIAEEWGLWGGTEIHCTDGSFIVS